MPQDQQDQIEYLKKELGELKQHLNEILSQSKRLIFLMDNDEATGRKGLFQDVEANKKAIQALEERITRVEHKAETKDKVEKTIIALVGFVASFVFWLIQNYIFPK